MSFKKSAYNILPIAVIAIGIMFYGCNQKQKTTTKTEIARFGDDVLNIEQIVFPANLTQQDSIEFIKKQTNDWLIRQAFAKKAFENIEDKDNVLEQKINDYKKTLYIHEYKQLLIEQKVDTLVTLQQIEEYYSKYGEEFRLTTHLVKAWVIMIPISMPNQNELMQYLRSDKESVIGDLKEICFKSARYFNFDNNWRPLHMLLNEASITAQTLNNDNVWKNKIISVKRDEFEIIIKINDFLKIGEKPPIESVSEQIKEIIIRKRKDQFFSRLENDLLQSVKENSKIKI